MHLKLREPNESDELAFLAAMQKSQSLHYPWINSLLTSENFNEYLSKSTLPVNKFYFLIDEKENLIGVFNLSEIVYGCFQNAYLGFYVIAGYEGKGLMSQGLKLVLKKTFKELGLHRIEANIQPENTQSINLVKRNGFRKEGFSPRYLKINNVWRDHERWAMAYEDWLSLKDGPHAII